MVLEQVISLDLKHPVLSHVCGPECNHEIISKAKKPIEIKVDTLKGLQKEHEEYDDEIKGAVTKIEDQYASYLTSKLEKINQRLLIFLRYKLNTLQKSEASIKADLKDYLGGSEFDTDLMFLTPLWDIGTDYQKGLINQRLQQFGLDTNQVSAYLGINFNPPQVQFTDLIAEREGFLSRTLAETTFDRTSKIIASGIKDGSSYQEIADRLSGALGFGGIRADLIARTETNWALNEGQRRYVQSLGVQKYQISVANTACPLCKSVAFSANRATEFPIEKMDILPIHPRCRCVLISVIPRDWFDPRFYGEPLGLKGKMQFTGSNNVTPTYKKVNKDFFDRPINNTIGNQQALQQWKGNDKVLELYHGLDASHVLKEQQMKAGEYIQKYGLTSGNAGTFGRGIYLAETPNNAAAYGKDVYKIYIKPDKLKLADYASDVLGDANYDPYLTFEAARRKKLANDELKPFFDQWQAGKLSKEAAMKEAERILKKYPSDPASLTTDFLIEKGFNGVFIDQDALKYYSIFDTTDKFIDTTSFNPIK